MSRYFWRELGSILYRVTERNFQFQMSYPTLPKVKSPNDFFTKKQPEKLSLKNPQEKLLQARNKKSSNRHKIAPQTSSQRKYKISTKRTKKQPNQFIDSTLFLFHCIWLMREMTVPSARLFIILILISFLFADAFFGWFGVWDPPFCFCSKF